MRTNYEWNPSKTKDGHTDPKLKKNKTCQLWFLYLWRQKSLIAHLVLAWTWDQSLSMILIMDSSWAGFTCRPEHWGTLDEDMFGTNTRMTMHYSWFQHQREGVSQAHTEIRTLWVSEKMMQGRGGGCRSRDEGTGVVGEVEDRWHSSMVPTCWWGSGLRTEVYLHFRRPPSPREYPAWPGWAPGSVWGGSRSLWTCRMGCGTSLWAHAPAAPAQRRTRQSAQHFNMQCVILLEYWTPEERFFPVWSKAS